MTNINVNITYHYAVYVGPLLMLRTKTEHFAIKRAKRWANARIVSEYFKGGSK
jgi:hypothetical protein